MEYKMMKCPLCFWINLVIPDEISHICPGHALAGTQGNLGSYKTHYDISWRGVKTHPNKHCGFNLFHQDGRPVHQLPLKEYIKFTQPEEFDVSRLSDMIITQSLWLYHVADTST